jgi:multiple sugar transport system permease protein
MARRGSSTGNRPMTRKPTEPLLFLLPALLVTAAVILYPALQTVWLGLHSFVLFDPDSMRFIGLGNFRAILADELFWVSLSNSVVWVVCAVGLQFALGLVTALLLNQTFAGRGLARALVVVPWALPSVIIGLMWTWMYDLNLGVFNDLLMRLGFIDAPVAWLAQPGTALAAVILALVWQGFPFFAVMILAGLQTIPSEHYEAAAIDGATRWQTLRFVTLPALREVIATALLLRTIWVANSLDVILVMTGGGPGYETHTLPLYAFLKAYSAMEFGYASALSLVLTLLLLLAVAFYVRRVARQALA